MERGNRVRRCVLAGQKGQSMTKSDLYALLGNQNANDPSKPGLILFDY